MENDKNSPTNEDLLAKMQEMESHFKAMEETLADALNLLAKSLPPKKPRKFIIEASKLPLSQQDVDVIYSKIPEGRRKVLNLFWLAKTDDEIASILGITKDTVRNIISKLAKDFKLNSELDVSKRSQLMELFIQYSPKLIEPERKKQKELNPKVGKVEKPKKDIKVQVHPSQTLDAPLDQQAFDMIYADLTESQKKVLNFFLAGYTDEQIASTMSIQKKSIRSVFSLISQSFGLRRTPWGGSRRLRLMNLFIKFNPELIENVDLVKQRLFFIDVYEKMSAQEKSVLNLFWNGNTDEKIAEVLSINKVAVKDILSQAAQSFELKSMKKNTRSELMKIKTVIEKYTRRKVRLSDEEIRDLVDNKGIKISEIARSQGVSAQSIYYHKKNADPKVEAVIEEKCDQGKVRLSSEEIRDLVDNKGVKVSEIAQRQGVSVQAIYYAYHKQNTKQQRSKEANVKSLSLSKSQSLKKVAKGSPPLTTKIFFSLNTRMNVVLVGEDGSGKTHTLESIIEYRKQLIAEKEIHYFDVTNFEPGQSVDSFLVSVSTPCILLLDNIDSLPPSFLVDLLNAVATNNPRVLFVATAKQVPPINKFDVNWHFLKPR